MKRGASSIARATTTAATATMDRKTVERNRRIKMKHLCSKLASLIPDSPQGPVSQTEQLEMATGYIERLRESVERLKERKAELEMQPSASMTDRDSRYPIMEIRDLGLCLEVILVSRPSKSFTLCQVVSALEDEGAEVVGVNVSTAANKVYHTLHAQVKCPRVGVNTSKIGGRLHQLLSSQILDISSYYIK